MDRVAGISVSFATAIVCDDHHQLLLWVSQNCPPCGVGSVVKVLNRAA